MLILTGLYCFQRLQDILQHLFASTFIYIVSSLFHASFLNTERARLRITITLVANRAWPHIEIENIMGRNAGSL